MSNPRLQESETLLMSKKQQAPPSQPPPSSSSSSSSSSEEEEEESPFSCDEAHTNYSSIPHHQKSPIQNEKSESDEESCDDEEDEDENENPQPVKKPTSNSTPHSKKPPTQNKKRESEVESSDGEKDEDEDEDENPQHVKKPIPSTAEPNSEMKMLASSKPPNPNKYYVKPPIVSVWSVDDQITILQAMLDHQSKNGHIELDVAGVKDLHESIQKSLSISVNTSLLAAKMRRMRKRYVNAKEKGAKLKFSHAHSNTIYDLSEKIWGNKEEEEEEEDEDLFVVKGKSHGAMVNKGSTLKRTFPFITDAFGGNRLALEILETIDVKKVVALEANFRKVKVAKINLTCEVYRLLQ